jgi:hypothetical protein
MTAPKANYQHIGCPNCGWHASFPGSMPPHQIHAELRRMREDILSERFDQTGSTHDAKRLLAQRRRRPGMKPNAVV